MKFKYVGKGSRNDKEVRVVGKYRWEKKNGFVQDVKEADLIENLKTYPDESFEEVKKDKAPSDNKGE